MNSSILSIPWVPGSATISHDVQDLRVVATSYAEDAEFWRNFSLDELLLDLSRDSFGAFYVSVLAVCHEEDQETLDLAALNISENVTEWSFEVCAASSLDAVNELVESCNIVKLLLLALAVIGEHLEFGGLLLEIFASEYFALFLNLGDGLINHWAALIDR